MSQAQGEKVYALTGYCLSEQTHTLIHYTIPVMSVIKSSSEDTCGTSQFYLPNNSDYLHHELKCYPTEVS